MKSFRLSLFPIPCLLLGLAVFSPSARADVDAIALSDPRRITWEADGMTASVYYVESTPDLTLTSGWKGVAQVVATGPVVSATLNVTNDSAFYRVLAVTSAFPQTRHEMVLVPDATFIMGNSFTNLNTLQRVEGFVREEPTHPVPVSSFLMDRFEVCHDKFIEVYNWAFSNHLVLVTNVVFTNVSGGVTNVFTNINTRVFNTEGTPRRLFDVNLARTEVGFTNQAFHLRFPDRTNFPVVLVSWFGAQAYCNYRSDMEGLPRAIDFGPTNWNMTLETPGYRLPTEAEWEKASRGGIPGTHFPWADDSAQGTNDYLWNIDPVKANYMDYRFVLTPGGGVVVMTNHPAHPWFKTGDYNNAPHGTTPVGYYNGQQQVEFKSVTNFWTQYKRGADWGMTQDMANAYGIYDMGGNAFEWCWDGFGTNWYGQAAASYPNTMGETNRNNISPPVATGLEGGRVYRGGGWIPILPPGQFFDPSYLRCAYRDGQEPNLIHEAIGFRTVRSIR